jgi:hypothetical protein
MAILHRKNSLSYKTLNGARTGDLFMSLIHYPDHGSIQSASALSTDMGFGETF